MLPVLQLNKIRTVGCYGIIRNCIWLQICIQDDLVLENTCNIFSISIIPEGVYFKSTNTKFYKGLLFFWEKWLFPGTCGQNSMKFSSVLSLVKTCFNYRCVLDFPARVEWIVFFFSSWFTSSHTSFNHFTILPLNLAGNLLINITVFLGFFFLYVLLNFIKFRIPISLHPHLCCLWFTFSFTKLLIDFCSPRSVIFFICLLLYLHRRKLVIRSKLCFCFNIYQSFYQHFSFFFALT